MDHYLAGANLLVTIGTSGNDQLVGSSPSRRALILSSEFNNPYTVWDTIPVSFGNGINIQQAQQPYIMRWHDFGDFIRQALYAVAAISLQVGVIDVQDCGCPTSDARIMHWSGGSQY